VSSEYNDGDSFAVDLGKRQVTARLYFVDCPETTATDATTARRLRTQTRYFGMENHQRTIFYGKRAARFTREQLARPFTVHTAFATALGRSTAGRVCAFVTTADGEDLARLLVANGLARARGFRRASPDGTHHAEVAARLTDLEGAAMLAGRGIWAEANPELLVQKRAEARLEEAELMAIQNKRTPALGSIDINSAYSADLESLPGIGPALAARIVAGRPYGSVDALLDVRGIGQANFRALRPYLKETPREP